jgi:hypothetical protein
MQHQMQAGGEICGEGAATSQRTMAAAIASTEINLGLSTADGTFLMTASTPLLSLILC